ncbi:hypothetical protein ACHAWO_012860 [Cyclotella atomus]|uniref:Uncharacterized protein n=1 Tax=Cyclotella atomus TaxID=382360 RepID=A0ABD3NUZ0_9STRA
MVLSTIDEVTSDKLPKLQIQTRFTPKSTRPSNNAYNMPYSTRNIANATEPLSTTSIVFSMKPHELKDMSHPKKIFFNPESRDDTNAILSSSRQRDDTSEGGFSDIFRRWEDGSVVSHGSYKSHRSSGSGGAKYRIKGGEGPLDNMSDVSSVTNNKRHSRSVTSKAEKSVVRKEDMRTLASAAHNRSSGASSNHRRSQTESALPRMDDWMNSKLDKYEKFKNGQVKKIELTPPKEVIKIETNEKIGLLPLTNQNRMQDKQRDNESQSTAEPRLDSIKSKLAQEDINLELKMQHLQVLGEKETLQNELEAKSHEIASLQHRLQDLEKWYQSRLEELGSNHRKAEKRHHHQMEELRNDWERSERVWMEEKEEMQKEIYSLKEEVREARLESMELEKESGMMEATQEENRRLGDEVRGYKLEIERLNKENIGVKVARESLERDVAYHRSEKERLESMHQSRLSELTEERRREKESHQAMVTSLMKEKERALLETAETKMRIQSMTHEMKELHQKETDRAFHEANEWKHATIAKLKDEHEAEMERAYRATQELDERYRDMQRQMQSVQRELEAEMTRNAAMNKDKNAMADILDNSVSKMEHMQRQILDLEKQNVDLMMANGELEAENSRVKLLAREKSSLEGAVDEYHGQMAELRRKNQELESETMSLKQELIDVLEVASHYQ